MAHYLTPEERAERVRQLTDKLESGISDVFQSDRYADYLRTMSKFHQYSFRNTILIFLQFPDASRVAGYNDWGVPPLREHNRRPSPVKAAKLLAQFCASRPVCGLAGP